MTKDIKEAAQKVIDIFDKQMGLTGEERDVIDTLKAALAELDQIEERLEILKKRLLEQDLELNKCYELIAPHLGFKPYNTKHNKEQIIWAKTQEEADNLRLGKSVYEFVKQAQAAINTISKQLIK